MTSLALLLAVILPSNPAHVRGRVAAIYAGLQTSSMQLATDTSRLPESIPGPSWATKWRVERDGGTRPGGTEAITLIWTSSDAATIRRDWIQVHVERQELVPVAKGRMQRGEPLDSNRIDWQWRPTNNQRIPPPNRDSLSKMRTRTGIAPGQALLRNQLEFLPVFRRGEMVRVKAGNQGASATVEAEALEDGFAGTVARLKSPWGGTISGIPSPDGTVSVH